ncbi:TetR/AcrR family transcriptional regulator [Tessaracoccus sp. OH4464_COT-324]|uniref:TetR/AcrR family transcriptional regulator n=1 Tax=Tessaracoccus sp. OH4464_COT-324 TaxID=2491059 RepID=UPI000F62F5CA|nr:TetR family transcriptional regulator [Tessaracoccus sp. OH4464_COT-324]RRD46620.1 TetR family transcriptional regulator [Tessaracoccus sp. OH4464_COT-324]
MERTTRARLRDAAIELVAEGHQPSARTVAERAGVSAGLVRHHFGSMSKLQAECDAHIARLIRQMKQEAIRLGQRLDVLQAILAADRTRALPYLAHRLGADSPEIDVLVDQLASDAEGYLREAVELGELQPIADLHHVAKLATLHALGEVALHRHLARMFHVDLTRTDLAQEPGFHNYLSAQVELYAGLMSPTRLALLRAYLQENR